MDMGRLDGRHLLVVGASSGVGRAVALEASREGASVALAARRVDRLDAASSKCSNPAFAVRCDVRDEQSCANAVEQAVAAMGGLDSLVYASGAMRFAELGQASLAD